MARQVLENGVILPAEYSDDWYDDMTSNLTKLDDVIGSDSEKLSSADVGAAALSNNYNDLDNLPTIPTVNDATLTIQKNGVDVQTFTANASSNVTANITVPTKTSDITNDSNFVDTSNPAVSSGITSAKVTDYDTHIADTDIHVTTADKNKWNNQTYVFRYSSTALTASSTNSNTLLDNTDNLKVGDKVIDSNGVLFSVTAIDTQNSTFTIGTALIDLAQDSDVVHKSGDETISGVKTFSDDIIRDKTTIGSRVITGNSNTPTIGSNGVGFIQNKATLTYSDSTPTKDVTVTLEVQDSNYTDGKSSAFYSNSNNLTNLGKSGKRWANVYATNYYYGGSEIEFSTKFVTTDTNQTISGNKTFSSTMILTAYPSIRMCLFDDEWNVQPATAKQSEIRFTDKNSVLVSYFTFQHRASSTEPFRTCWRQQKMDGTNGYYSINFNNLGNFYPENNNSVSLGLSNYKWLDVQTYKVNNLNPSSLSLPSSSGTIDISSYITDLTGGSVNNYTPSANGYIVITCNANDVDYIKMSNNLDFVSVVDNTNNQFTSGILGVWQPCIAGIGIQIRIKSSALKSAKFIPCQGNV